MSTVKFGPGVVLNPTPLSAPFIGTATLLSTASTTALVSYTVPSYTGCIPILRYVATSNQGGLTATITQSGSGTITVNGLSYGNTYTFVVSAFNGFGQGPASTSSNSVSPIQIPPGPPQLVSAAFATASSNAYISFAAPACNGGSPVLYYTAVSTPGSYTATLSQASSGSILVSGLQGDTYYTFTVNATNAIGTGTNSASSNSIYYHNPGSYVYTSLGLHSVVFGSGICQVSAVVIGGGCAGHGFGGGGGNGSNAVFYNCIPVTPGQTYYVFVGRGGIAGGAGNYNPLSYACSSAFYCNASGFSVTSGASANSIYGASNSSGGPGGNYACHNFPHCSCGGGGGSGGYGYVGGGGGGGNVYGKTSNGTNGSSTSIGYGQYSGNGGGGGSGGGSGGSGTYVLGCCSTFGYIHSLRGGAGGSYGGGGGGATGNYCGAGGNGGQGIVRIVWPGSVTQRIRQFPSTCVGSP